jgi:aminoglycoside 6'-N-acetyltransferase
VTDNVKEVRLVSFDPERDFDLVSNWVRRPHVSRWWGDSVKALDEIIERPDVGGDAIIIADEVPVGYIRWQKPSRSELDEAGLLDVDEETTMDIDVAIGEPEFIGLGIGSRAVELVVEQLVADSSLSMIMIVTSVDNVAAAGSYEKAGFERRRKFDDPEYGECWLLTLDV